MRLSRSTGAISGLLILVLGAWAGLSPFIGPSFGYSFSPDATWHYTTDRLWLSILPGAISIFAGMILLVAATRASGILGGSLAALSGGWLVVGPAVSLTWETGQGPIGRPLFGSTRQMIELVGSFYGVGLLIASLGAFCVGRFASRTAWSPAGPARRVPPAPDTSAGPPPARPIAHRERRERGRARLPFAGRRARARGAGAEQPDERSSVAES
jgi:hypothetical protein